jgi:glycerol uptake facilitator-like aquaporin
MFGLPLVTLSTHHRATGPHLFAEVVATFGLVLVAFAVVRSGRASTVALAVGSYIAGAYFFTSSTSFANPAVTVARMLSNTFAGIAPSSAGPFVAVELGGGVVGLAVVLALYPKVRDVASRVVLPHEEAA